MESILFSAVVTIWALVLFADNYCIRHGFYDKDKKK